MPKTETKTVIVKDEYDDDEEFELQDELQQENMMDEDTEDEAPNNSSDQSRRGSASQVLPGNNQFNSFATGFDSHFFHRRIYRCTTHTLSYCCCNTDVMHKRC